MEKKAEGKTRKKIRRDQNVQPLRTESRLGRGDAGMGVGGTKCINVPPQMLLRGGVGGRGCSWGCGRDPTGTA